MWRKLTEIWKVGPRDQERLTCDPGDVCNVKLQRPSFIDLREVELMPSLITQEQSSISSPENFKFRPSTKKNFTERNYEYLPIQSIPPAKNKTTLFAY